MSFVFHIVFWIFMIWLIRRDTVKRQGISAAIWIPTLWIGILASKPLTAWVGFGGSEGSLEGSPLDRTFYFFMIFAAIRVLSKRRVDWGELVSKNWPIFILYGYLLVTVLWANSPVASAKRWFKELGNVFVILVLLTEIDPLQAIRAVFVRCAYVLIPLSVAYIRYFPELGRRYSRSGALEVTGATQQKNSLGSMVLVFGLILVWDWIERSRASRAQRDWISHNAAILVTLMGGYLINLSDSKTSIVCMILGIGIIATIRLPFLRQKIDAFGIYILSGGMIFFIFDQMIGITEWIVKILGRDMTFTGRTDVWRVLLGLQTDPIAGTGFMSLWDDPHYRSILPYWVASSAHNGYLEIYLAGGLLGVSALGICLIVTGSRINKQLESQSNFAVVRFAILVIAILANFSESNFCSMSPVGFLFLIAAIGDAPVRFARDQSEETKIENRTNSGSASEGAALESEAESHLR